MSELSRDTLLYALPEVLSADRGMNALAETAAQALEALWQSVDLPIIYARIDQLDEALLDILAHDFKVDWYDYNADISVKRAQIRDCFYVHRHLGTASAVKRALGDIWPGSALEEWFEYGGDPYHFRVRIAANDYDAVAAALAQKAIRLTKNVRSVLDGITIQAPDEIVIELSTGYAFVETLMPSNEQLTNANDIADWDAPDEAEPYTDTALVGYTTVGEEET